MPLPWPATGDEAADLPVEDLALRVLTRLIAADYAQHGRRPNRLGTIATWVTHWDQSGPGRNQDSTLQARVPWSEALGEAWDWLHQHGLIAQAVKPWSNTDAYFITRRGLEIVAEDDPLSVLRAQRRLGVELHDRLMRRVGALTRVGAFEQAAFDALREVEVRVRDLAGDPRNARGARLVGTDLMHHAFRSDGGPLADSDAERGEQQGVMELFAGAFGAVRNPLGHDHVEWSDPTEAAEMILLADLLMRQLDRVERRVAAP